MPELTLENLINLVLNAKQLPRAMQHTATLGEIVHPITESMSRLIQLIQIIATQ